jgi:hypothetical protein
MSISVNTLHHHHHHHEDDDDDNDDGGGGDDDDDDDDILGRNLLFLSKKRCSLILSILDARSFLCHPLNAKQISESMLMVF